jgi:hypothetical protein
LVSKFPEANFGFFQTKLASFIFETLQTKILSPITQQQLENLPKDMNLKEFFIFTR